MTKTASKNGVLPFDQKSQDRHSARAVFSLSKKGVGLSARYRRIAPRFKSRTRVYTRSTQAGIFEFGFMWWKPLPGWSPSMMFISHHRTPHQLFRGAKLLQHNGNFYAIGCHHGVQVVTDVLPTGRTFSCVGPAIGRLMLAKWPATGLIPGPNLWWSICLGFTSYVSNAFEC